MVRELSNEGVFAQMFREKMRDPEFRSEYERARGAIAHTQTMLRVIDERRKELRISKAELARRAHVNPAVVRRLFTSTTSNPTMATLFDVLGALGARDIHVEFEPVVPQSEAMPAQAVSRSSNQHAAAELPQPAMAE